ncbi:MAG: AbrB/MazE/SpoVT family DNA-binding domain-containing protein [Candidatus Marsarchaeota archaeon]|jgi:AbrB family looped-hinge helix DNA binding protein|nr:AbrB/MazE/SpoVT family DNA-binding domain-containing protein [Candidatus Marsarchaeota archaeon]
MSKIYRSKDKLIVYIPRDVQEGLDLREGDEIDFFKYRDRYYILAKKSDITELLTELGGARKQQAPAEALPQRQAGIPAPEELAVLKKLDTLRYNDRTEDKVNGLLSAQEKLILQKLMKEGFVELFSKAGATARYSIPKRIYDRFLMRKKPEAQQAQQKKGAAVQFKPTSELAAEGAEQYIKKLETDGFIVVPTEAEAQNVSLAMEDSIRRGLVLGTRAFNRRFYIATRGFLNKNSPGILKAIEKKSVGVSDIARTVGIDEDGVRAVLYILSENGDVTEVRKDVFRQA